MTAATDISAVPSQGVTADLMRQLGVPDEAYTNGDLPVRSPINGCEIARVATAARSDVGRMVSQAHSAFELWRMVPAPKRGELVRRFGEALRCHKAALGQLISLETGKIMEEGLGEVQEMIDMCDFAAGLSRQLYGLTMASERKGHKMMETWHPLGVVGIINLH